jgi:hypothetical protein
MAKGNKMSGFAGLAALRADLPAGTPIEMPSPTPEPVVIVPSVGTDLEARRAAHSARKDAELRTELDAIAAWEMEKLREWQATADEIGPDVFAACYEAIAAKHGASIGTVECAYRFRYGPSYDGEGIRHEGGYDVEVGERAERVDEYHARLKALEPEWWAWAVHANGLISGGAEFKIRQEAQRMARNKKFLWFASGPRLDVCPWKA